MEVIDPRRYGAVLDGVTDDTAAIQRTVDYFGATGMKAGVMSMPGIAAISNTILAEKMSLVITGYGWGGTARYRSGFKWIGAAGGTMLRLQACWASHLYGLLFLGHVTNKPVALSMYNVTGDGLPNSYNRVERCMFGTWPYGTDNEALLGGIKFEGDNVNNDKNVTTGCTFRNCDIAYDQTQSQNVRNAVRDTHFVGCGTAVKTVASLTLDNVMHANCGIDWHVRSGASLSVRGTSSELSGLMAKLENSSNLTVEHGDFQVGDTLTNATVIDWIGNNNGAVVLEHFALNRRPGYAGAEPQLRIKASPGGAAKKLIRLRDVSGITLDNLDVAIQSASDKRIVEHDSPRATLRFRNVLDGSGTLNSTVWQDGTWAA